METKRRWGLVFTNAMHDRTVLNGTTFTARGRSKAEKKFIRLIDRRRGLALLIDIAPQTFSLEIIP